MDEGSSSSGPYPGKSFGSAAAVSCAVLFWNIKFAAPFPRDVPEYEAIFLVREKFTEKDKKNGRIQRNISGHD